ncbi:hypothetical protein BH10PSE12_BH10PSE12_24190 [soil metagenome]
MTRIFAFALAALAAMGLAAGLSAQSGVKPGGVTQSVAAPAGLKPLSDFTGIADPKARSLALFTEVGKVIQHPRCLNCHPRTDTPTQTDFMRKHAPMVVRGDSNFGAAGLHCSTCHHDANFDTAGVPGAPNWMLAPKEMAWQGETLGNICRQIKDRKRNGDKDMPALIHHMAEDTLVGWGWHPGGNRSPAPGTQKQFGELFKAWADSGAYCPA